MDSLIAGYPSMWIHEFIGGFAPTGRRFFSSGRVGCSHVSNLSVREAVMATRGRWGVGNYLLFICSGNPRGSHRHRVPGRITGSRVRSGHHLVQSDLQNAFCTTGLKYGNQGSYLLLANHSFDSQPFSIMQMINRWCMQAG